MRYQLDFFTVTAICAAALDALTTCCFIVTGAGSEMNSTLSPLIEHSLVWIFFYILCRPLIIPLLPDLSRVVFAVFFSTVCLVFAANNFGGLFNGDYFATRIIGFEGVIALGYLMATVAYAYHCIVNFSTLKDWIRNTIWMFGFVVLFSVIEWGFVGMGSLIRRTSQFT